MASRLFLLGLVAAVVADEGDDCSLTDRQPKRVSSHKNTAICYAPILRQQRCYKIKTCTNY